MKQSVVAVIPAYDAAETVGTVVRDVRAAWPWPDATVIVIDDGSADSTSEVARSAGAIVLRHARNRGKGAALRTGFLHALSLGAELAVSIDADGQHPAGEAARLAAHPAPPRALLLGVRDLARDGAPRPNRMSNAISNFFLSLFGGRPLQDTQCGLRRYPVSDVLALGGVDDGYAYESELILRACLAGFPIVEEPVRVHYPPEHLRVTHFDSVRDPARIVVRVVSTLAETRGRA